jgi:hypothetical protein
VKADRWLDAFACSHIAAVLAFRAGIEAESSYGPVWGGISWALLVHLASYSRRKAKTAILGTREP